MRNAINMAGSNKGEEEEEEKEEKEEKVGKEKGEEGDDRCGMILRGPLLSA